MLGYLFVDYIPAPTLRIATDKKNSFRFLHNKLINKEYVYTYVLRSVYT